MEKDGPCESVVLKNCEYLGKVGVPGSDALKQLRLSSRGVAVYVDLHLVLYTSPFLSTLLEQLRDCCISGHDEVDILVEPFSPDLLQPFKSLVETGECWVKYQHDKEGLEDLIKELGMDLVVTLLMGGKGEESCTDIVISDYEELDDCVEIDGHNSSVGWEDSQTPPEETIQDTIADNSGQNVIEESYLPMPQQMSHKRKVVGNATPFILAATKRKCFVNMNQQNLSEENCHIVKKQLKQSENLYLSKDDGAICENKTIDKQQDFIEKYIEEHIRKNSVEISETSVTVVKPDLTNFSSNDVNCDETVQCQICQYGNFIEKDLLEHLYKNHIGLQRKINKAFAEKIPSYYTLERNKKNCSCPICGKVMKAVRNKVGLHWAVDHKQMKTIYEEEINEKKRQELLKSAQGSSDKEVSHGMKEKVIETAVNDVDIKKTDGKSNLTFLETELLRRKAEVHDVGIKKTEENRRKAEVHGVGILKTEGKSNLTSVETELSKRKAEVNDVGITKTEGKSNLTLVEAELSKRKAKVRKNYLSFVETEPSRRKTEVRDEEKSNLTLGCTLQDEQLTPLLSMRKNWQKRVQTFVSNITTVNQESTPDSLDGHETVVQKKEELLFPTNSVIDNSQDITETIDHEEVVENANESSSLETNLNTNTNGKEYSIRVLKSLEDFIADQEKINENESFAFRRNTVSNMNLDIKENSLKQEPKLLKISMADQRKDVKENESLSPEINDVDKEENSLVKESLLLQDLVTGQKKLVKQEANVNEQELPLEKLPPLENSDRLCTKKPDVCLMDTIVDNLKDMDELGTAIIIREASRHRIENSSGKLKQQLVEDLWDHYLEFHSVHVKFECKQSDPKVDYEEKSNYYSPSLRAEIFPELESESDSD